MVVRHRWISNCNIAIHWVASHHYLDQNTKLSSSINNLAVEFVLLHLNCESFCHERNFDLRNGQEDVVYKKNWCLTSFVIECFTLLDKRRQFKLKHISLISIEMMNIFLLILCNQLFLLLNFSINLWDEGKFCIFLFMRKLFSLR